MLSVIPNPPRVLLPVADSDDVYPVRRIYCVGRNYGAHAREMGADPDREPPFFFMKPADAILAVTAETPAELPYPTRTESFHFEVELVAALGHGGSDIAERSALAHVYGYAVGLDMTRRDLQDEAKRLSRPWDIAKGADHSAPIGPLHPAGTIGHPSRGTISLDIDGERRQAGDLSEMIWSLPEQIALLSTYFTLHPGDLIFTGTPSGVGPVTRGETMRATIEGLGAITLRVV